MPAPRPARGRRPLRRIAQRGRRFGPWLLLLACTLPARSPIRLLYRIANGKGDGTMQPKERGMNQPTEKGLLGAAAATNKPLTRKGGELIAEFLVRENIPYVFGICGHGNVGLLDPLYEVRDKVRLVSPRHEQTAGHMADGYFRVKHKPVATLTSTGPGSANLIMALAVAQTDSSALLAITANVPTSQFNRGPFQELNRHNQADFPNVIRPVVKRSFQPSRVDMLPLALRQAVTTMTSGRPGPVNLDVPFNLFQEEAEVELEQPWDGFDKRRSGASSEDVQKTIDLLAA